MSLLKKIDLTKLNEYQLIRHNYNIEASVLSTILGFGINQWRMYEKGQTEPTTAHYNLVQMIKDPFTFQRLLEQLPAWQVTKLGKKFARTKSAVDQIIKDCNYQAQQARERFIEGLYNVKGAA